MTECGVREMGCIRRIVDFGTATIRVLASFLLKRLGGSGPDSVAASEDSEGFITTGIITLGGWG